MNKFAPVPEIGFKEAETENHPSEVGNSKGKINKSDVLQIRLSPKQKKKLESFAKSQSSNPSEIIRKYIDRLPNKSEGE